MNTRSMGISAVLCLLLMTILSISACKNSSSSKFEPAERNNEACLNSTSAPVFTHPITDVSSLAFIEPLPALAGGVSPEARTYMHPKSSMTGISIPIYAPADLDVVAAKQYRPSGVPSDYVNDWEMLLDVNCKFTIMLAHVKAVDPRIQTNTTAPVDSSSAPVQLTSAVHFAAGDIIGYYIKGSQSIAWDFLVMDKTIQNNFANAPRYLVSSSKLLWARCPYDYYSDVNIKNQFLGLLGSAQGGAPVPGMGCGTVEHDVLETAAGYWYSTSDSSAGIPVWSTDGIYGTSFNIFLSVDGSVLISGVGANGSRVTISPSNTTFLDPQDIKTNHCYAIQPTPTTYDGYVYVQVVSLSQINVSYSSSGVCPGQPPLDYRAYYR